MKRILVTLLIIGLGGLWTFAQNKVSGIVYSQENGNTLQGASVRLTNGSSMQTGENGTFELSMTSAFDTLFISYVGYLQKRLVITDGTNSPLKIYLDMDSSALEEVEV